jgi:hypothetical protein
MFTRFAKQTTKNNIMKVVLPQQHHELLFPWSLNVDEDHSHPDAIKWRQNNTSYKVNIHTLKGDDATHVQNMLPHGLRFRNKVLNAVGNVNHQGPSLFQTFPRSLEEELQNIACLSS